MAGIPLDIPRELEEDAFESMLRPFRSELTGLVKRRRPPTGLTAPKEAFESMLHTTVVTATNRGRARKEVSLIQRKDQYDNLGEH